MIDAAIVVFALVAGIVAIGFAGELFFKKTGIPIFIFLILIGILLGPVLNLFPRDSLLPVLTPFAQLTLLMVLFYGGLGLNIESVLRCGGRAFAQVLLYVSLSTVVVGLVATFFLKWDLLLSFIFASMIAGETTAAVIIPLSKSMRLSDSTVTFLTMESAINSIFDIVLFSAFVGIYTASESSWTLTFSSITAQFSVGIVLGALLGVVWIFLLNHFQKQKFTYVLTIGLVLSSYAITTVLGGNGILAVLVFGIIFGNYQLVNRLFGRKINVDSLQRQLERFQGEISFLLRTLFFVFLGLTFIINPSTITTNFSIALLFLLVLLTVRFVATRVSTYKSELQKDSREILFMCAQGLTPATLAALAVSLELPKANTFLNIVTYIIILTNVVTTAGSLVHMRRHKLKLHKPTETNHKLQDAQA